MSYEVILQQFESATLKPFGHREHILVAWLYLRRDGWDNGYAHIQDGIKHFAQALGVSDKYHETITRFWATLVQHCIEQSDTDDFDVFIGLYPFLLDKGSMTSHYSVDILKSLEARQQWVEPDLIPMPSR